MELLHALWNLVLATAELLVVLVWSLAPWTPLLAWVAFWLLAVNWRKLSPVLIQGGWVGVALILLVAVLVWSSIAPPAAGKHFLLGLQLDNFYGKFVYVSGLAVIALLCGTAQNAGVCAALCRFDEPAPAADDHGHDDHGHH
jgi:hypothetical protein